jgi:signal transduction histidine kinase/ActR/RegA family two-component response regulator
MLGYTHDELLSMRSSEVIHPDDIAAVPLPFGIPPGGVIVSERRFMRKDGSVMPGELSTKALLDGSFQVVVRDVTDRKSAEAQVLLADRMSSLGRLASGVAHEINNPLAYVMLNLDFVTRQVAELGARVPWNAMGDMTEALRHAKEGTERMRQIVRALGDFGRGDEERVCAVDVNRVLDAAVEIAGLQLKHRTRVTRHYQPELFVRANEFRLGQVFVNLLVNAADALREGERNNEIALHTFARDERSVAVQVRDNGQGMPPSLVGRIFDPFFTTKPIGEGTGLGLSVCHSIVTSFGGTIQCESAEGAGTTFTVLLAAAENETDGVLASSPARSPVVAGRVLVVDDDPRVARAMASALAGHEVAVVSSGTEAVARCENESYDCVLCDVMMPGVSGIEVHRALLQQGHGLEGNVVFMTGGAVTERARSALANMGRPVLQKPIDFATLREAVSRTVKHSQDARRAG